eukprot:8839174-Pyramimonas_sp.AAC.1
MELSGIMNSSAPSRRRHAWCFFVSSCSLQRGSGGGREGVGMGFDRTGLDCTALDCTELVRLVVSKAVGGHDARGDHLHVPHWGAGVVVNLQSEAHRAVLYTLRRAIPSTRGG